MPEPGSILDQITRQVEGFADEMFTDLSLSMWGQNGHPPAWFRIRPVDSDFIEKQRARAAKAKGPAISGAVVRGNLAILAMGVEAFIVGEGDGQAQFTLDSEDLKKALGVPDAETAGDVVRAILGVNVTKADGYVLSLSDAVVRHSGHAAQIAEENALGE